MTIDSIKNELCCGCSGCASICPKSAITMIENEKGFLVPAINKELCIECNLCYNVCQEKNNYKKSPLYAFGFKHNSHKVLMNSSSGGASRAFCEAMISKNGVVYGIAYTDEFEVVTMRATTLSECDKFYGSKYVAANPQDSFRLVYKDLKNGKEVLYISTSCYIAGLLSFLHNMKCDSEKLITVDLICHGVPSQKLFRDYIEYITKRKKLEKIDFRSKKLGWKYGVWATSLTWIDGKSEINTLRSRIYLNMFCSNTCLRETCYSCQYVGKNRTGDLTISDFWGVEKNLPKYYSESGVSAVEINSNKGYTFWCSVASKHSTIEVSPDIVISYNLNKPTTRSPNTEIFWNDYLSNGFKSVAKKYGGNSFRGWIRISKFHKIWTRIRYGK